MLNQTALTEFTGINFRSLARIKEPVCLSIFLPDTRMRGDHEHRRTLLEGLVSQAEQLLRARGFESAIAHDLLAPLQALNEDGFWQQTRESMAIFRTVDSLQLFSASLPLQQRVVVGHRLFLKPLLRSLTRKRRYYVLAVSDNLVRLFQCRETECVQLHSDDLPSGLKNTLKSRDFSPSLQGHTSKSSNRKVLTHHGHAALVEDTHENRVRYCRQIDSGVHRLIGHSDEPLILACVRELFAGYQQVNTYPRLLPEPIPGSPDRLTPESLHSAAQAILDSELEKEIARARSSYIELENTEQSSANADAILTAASDGRIQTVLMADEAEMWGVIDRSSGGLRLAIGTESPSREELLNVIAVESVANGGLVYSLPLDSMPHGKPVVALFR